VTGLCESVNAKTKQAFWWIFDNNLKPPFEFIRDDAVPGSRGQRRGLRYFSCSDCRFESRRGHGSLLSVVCCKLLVSATGRSFTQRSPIECGVSEFDLEISTRGRRRSTRTVES
jgi:hypothetical protein